MTNLIEEIDEPDLKKVLEDNKVVIVDYSAVWCGPCKIQHMILENLQKKYQNKGEIEIKMGGSREVQI